jgi:hypothetical protein
MEDEIKRALDRLTIIASLREMVALWRSWWRDLLWPIMVIGYLVILILLGKRSVISSRGAYISLTVGGPPGRAALRRLVTTGAAALVMLPVFVLILLLYPCIFIINKAGQKSRLHAEGLFQSSLARRFDLYYGVAKCVVYGLGGMISAFCRVLGASPWIGRYGGRRFRSFDQAELALASDSEEALVRLAVSLRLTHRHGMAVSLLRLRIETSLPSGESRAILSDLLREIGENDAASRLAPGQDVQPVFYAPDSHEGEVRFGIVVTVTGYNVIEEPSLHSLLASNYRGEIVVVEDGVNPHPQLRAFCEAANLPYIKCARWEGVDAMMNIGIRAFVNDPQIVAFAHSDVLWPPKWFNELALAWGDLLPRETVSFVNLGYYQFDGAKDLAMEGLFRRGSFDTLMWPLRESVRAGQLRQDIFDATWLPFDERIGISMNPWTTNFVQGNSSIAHFSPVVTFRKSLWEEMGGFFEPAFATFDSQLMLQAIKRKQLPVTMNNVPFIHMVSGATKHVMSADQYREFLQRQVKGEALFRETFKIAPTHLMHIFGMEFAYLYAHKLREIVYGDGTYRAWFFEQLSSTLENRTLAKCAVVVCHLRNKCPYEGRSSKDDGFSLMSWQA